MTSFEKKLLIALMVGFGVLVVSIVLLGRAIDEAGGIKGIAVEIGKDVKDVVREVEKH